MYPTDVINPLFFNFSESQSVNEQFEELGYEGTNFIELTGSLLYNLLLIFLTMVVAYIANQAIRTFLSKYQFARKLAIKF
jgi:hypothetical protein